MTLPPLTLGEILARAPVIPVLIIDDVAHAVPLGRALAAGGLSVLEVTLRTPVADRKAYSLEEVADILDMHLRTIYRLTAAGKIVSVKIGGRRLVRAEEIVRLLAEGTEG